MTFASKAAIGAFALTMTGLPAFAQGYREWRNRVPAPVPELPQRRGRFWRGACRAPQYAHRSEPVWRDRASGRDRRRVPLRRLAGRGRGRSRCGLVRRRACRLSARPARLSARNAGRQPRAQPDGVPGAFGKRCGRCCCLSCHLLVSKKAKTARRLAQATSFANRPPDAPALGGLCLHGWSKPEYGPNCS